MTNEMDVMKLDEREQLAWLRANRLTLMVVGLVWLGMIGWEVASGRAPYFQIVMVPVFALVRFLGYRFYRRIRTDVAAAH